MKISSTIGCLFAALSIQHVAAQRQTLAEAAVDARHMIMQETEGTLLSTYQESVAPTPELVGSPIGIMEYFADCSTDGSPTMLMLDIAPAMRNYRAGSKLTLSLRDHGYDNPLQHGRMYMIGNVTQVAEEDEERVEACFLAKHPDSEIVAPGRDVHSSQFYTLDIESIYYFGGFGNVSFIGFIPTDVYHAAKVPALKPLRFQA